VTQVADVLGEDPFEVTKRAAAELGFGFAWLATKDGRDEPKIGHLTYPSPLVTEAVVEHRLNGDGRTSSQGPSSGAGENPSERAPAALPR
jgi:hypothetical protein